MKDFLMIS